MLERYRAIVYYHIGDVSLMAEQIACADYDVEIVIGVQCGQHDKLSLASQDVMALMGSYLLVSSDYDRDVDSDAPLFERRLIYRERR